MRLQNTLLRLVKGGPELRAVEAGEIDAVIDHAGSNVILLPEAQRAVLEHKARFRSLLALSSDWYWQQDEHYRFAAGESAAGERSGFDLAHIIGKTLWELPFDNMSETDWQAHRRQLQRRATFHDLELRYLDRAGAARWISLDGGPIFDEQERFKGYRGTARDITERKHAEGARQESNRFARAALDALSAQVCVLDSAGTVIMANKAWRAFAPAAEGIAAGVPEGASYLAVCDNAAGSERADGVAIAAGIRQVTGKERSLFRHEYACDSPAGRCRVVVTITGFREEGAARAVVSRENITGRKPAEQPLKLDYPVADPGRAASTEPAANVVNGLLASLPAEEYQRLLANLEPVTLKFGEVLHEPGVPIRYVYFPIDCVISLLTTARGHHALEVGLVGHEGIVGIPLALGIDVSSFRALVQRTGIAMRMESAPFCKEFLQSESLQHALYRYKHALMGQIAQIAVCNQFHSVEERLARRLLMTRDRARSNEFRLTHQFLADMLGARRVGVTNAATALRKRKLIKYGHGEITILDRRRLSVASCECYQIIKGIYDSAQADG